MKTITTSQLLDILARVESATPIAFTANTKVDARKEAILGEYGSELIPTTEPSRNPRKVVNPFYGTLRQLTRVHGFTGNGFGGFQRAVRREQTKESQSPTFVSGEREWGEQVTPAIVRRGTHAYLATQVLSKRTPVYFAPQNGLMQVVASHIVAPFIPPDRSGFKQQLERPVVRRDYALESIRSLTLKGETYKIVS